MSENPTPISNPPLPPPQQEDTLAKLLYDNALLDSIANLEVTIHLYDVLLSSAEARLAAKSGDEDTTAIKWVITQFRSYRTKIAIRRKALLEELQSTCVSQPGLVNRTIETAFSGSREEMQKAYEFYWEKIREAHGRMQRRGNSLEEKANVKVLWDCQKILREKMDALKDG